MTDGQVPNKARKSDQENQKTYAEVHRLAATAQLEETRERNSRTRKIKCLTVRVKSYDRVTMASLNVKIKVPTQHQKPQSLCTNRTSTTGGRREPLFVGKKKKLL